jgi:hypothetical protein
VDLIGLEPYDRPDGRGNEEAKRSSGYPSSITADGILITIWCALVQTTFEKLAG